LFFALQGCELLAVGIELFFKNGQLRADGRAFGCNGADTGLELLFFQD
jgi:hypothetical protein